MNAPRARAWPRWTVALVALQLMLVACDKVPLRNVGQHLRYVNAHWFEAEKTTYVFFEVDAAQPSSSQSVFELKPSSESAEFRALSPTWSIHDHQVVTCGDHLCGSFSYKSETAPSAVTLRLRYHPGSPLEEHLVTGVQTHADDGTAQAYSALVYGVFSAGNDRVQLRMEPNFGDPNAVDIAKYGMTRRFESVDEASTDFTSDQLDRLKSRTLSPFLYPADLCSESLAKTHGSGKRGPVTQMRGNRAWSGLLYDATDTNAGACLQVNTLDHDGRVILSQFAIARKNPVLTQSPLRISTPLHSTVKVPIVVGFCAGPTGEPSAMSAPAYLDYQKHILGIEQSSLDACFSLGSEEQFNSAFHAALLRKLEAARAAAAGGSTDLLFTVVLNHRLGAEFDYLQQIVQRRLDELINAEAGKISPRLVGAFVYDSSENYAPKAAGNPALIWCPRVRQKSDRDTLADHGVNCITDQSGGIDLSIISAVAPLGPFPNLSSFEDYVSHWGSGGLLHEVEFSVRSVPSGPNTVQDNQAQVTYFDGVRVSLPNGHGARVCNESDDGTTLASLRFLNTSNPPSTAIDAQNVDSQMRVGGQSFKVGIEWEFPFLIEVAYTEKASGKILGFVPFSASGKANKVLGEPKWNRAEWDIGPYFQRCERFCDHPFFDNAGTYQVDLTWRNDLESNCPQTQAPVVLQ